MFISSPFLSGLLGVLFYYALFGIWENGRKEKVIEFRPTHSNPNLLVNIVMLKIPFSWQPNMDNEMKMVV